jgi:hypothetical protein
MVALYPDCWRSPTPPDPQSLIERGRPSWHASGRTGSRAASRDGTRAADLSSGLRQNARGYWSRQRVPGGKWQPARDHSPGLGPEGRRQDLSRVYPADAANRGDSSTVGDRP